MKLSFRLTISLLLILLVAACNIKTGNNKENGANKPMVIPQFTKMYPNFDAKIFQAKLKDELQKDSVLNILYAKNEFKSLWLEDTLNTAKLYQLVAIFNDAQNHGLSSNSFSANKIDSVVNNINKGMYASNLDSLYKVLAGLEKLTAKAIIKYTKGMRVGFVDPYTLFKKDYTISVAKADSTFYENLYAEINADPITAIETSHPTDKVYLEMQKAYKNYAQLKDAQFYQIEKKGDSFSYKLGDKNKNISHIANRLQLTGDYQPDSLISDSIATSLDRNLLVAINKFRTKMTYCTDSLVGSATIDILNRPIAYYQKKLEANMERYRWRKTKAAADKNIEVNVAAFHVVSTQPDSLPLIIKVCAGSVTNKTPLLESNLEYLNLNPTWGVPTSIARNEISVLQKKDPSYLRRNNMKLYKGGKEVDASSINWSEIKPEKFAYSVQQGSGAGNALGRIKFMFKNPFAVYLHDTPTRKPFDRQNRAVSHGCVRVEKPLELARFCLSPISDVGMDEINYSIGYEPKSEEGRRMLKEGKLKKLENIINIDTKQKISIFIDYRTVYMLPHQSELFFANDTYNYDEQILKALNEETNI